MARKPATANLTMSHRGEETVAAEHHVAPENSMERLIRRADDADVNRGQPLKGLSDEELLAAFR